MGPSQEFAYKQAEEFTRIVKDLMKLRHINVDPENMTYNFANMRDDQIVNFIVLEDIIKEIFWTDACLSF